MGKLRGTSDLVTHSTPTTLSFNYESWLHLKPSHLHVSLSLEVQRKQISWACELACIGSSLVGNGNPVWDVPPEVLKVKGFPAMRTNSCLPWATAKHCGSALYISPWPPNLISPAISKWHGLVEKCGLGRMLRVPCNRFELADTMTG